MKILAIVGIIFFNAKISTTSSCSRELKYHDEYGIYGTDIKCQNLTNNDKTLTELASYNPTSLQIRSSVMTEVTPKLFESVKTLRILEIINSTFLHRSTVDVFRKFKHLEHLIVEDSTFGELTADTFRSLEYLEELRLENISISSLPKTSLKSLRNLLFLDLSRNKFTSINSVPICEVPKLKRIILEHNEIETLESSTFLCRHFEDSIDFDLNSFKYEVDVPKPIYYNNSKSKSNIVEINLSYNKLVSLSSGLAELKTLKLLNLEDNKLSVLHGHEFNFLVNLQKLNLKSNQLTEIKETLLSQIKSIKFLNFENNRITNITITELKFLENVNLARNRFMVSNLEMWNKVPVLEYLDISYNGIKEISSSTFRNIQNLEHLNLSGNTLVLANDTFKFLHSLVDLNLSFNNLTVLPPNIFSNLTKLGNLDLSRNNLSSFSYDNIFKDQIALERLNLSYNKLEHFSKQLIRPLKNLQLLDIDGNHLKVIEFDIFTELPYLSVINIRNNEFSCQFLTDLLKFLKNNSIVYSAEKVLNSTAENVGGIPCTESVDYKNITSETTTEKIVNNPEKIVSKPERIANKPEKIMSDPTPVSPLHSEPKPVTRKKASSLPKILGTTFAVVVICSLLGYSYYRYFRKKRYINDQFELISD